MVQGLHAPRWPRPTHAWGRHHTWRHMVLLKLRHQESARNAAVGAQEAWGPRRPWKASRAKRPHQLLSLLPTQPSRGVAAGSSRAWLAASSAHLSLSCMGPVHVREKEMWASRHHCHGEGLSAGRGRKPSAADDTARWPECGSPLPPGAPLVPLLPGEPPERRGAQECTGQRSEHR